MSTSDLALTELVERALEEARLDDGDRPVPHRVELQSRATEEVFALALRWATTGEDLDVRCLGIDVLRELGPADAAGRRPFSDRAIPELLALLSAEDDPGVERRLLQALAFNGAVEAVVEFLGRVDHADAGVRTTVAFQLPYLTDPADPTPAVLDALEHLTADSDSDVRYYALYALLDEAWLSVDPVRAQRAAQRLVDDQDPDVRDLARSLGGSAHDGTS